MTLDQRILNLIKNYMGKLWHKKVLTSMEEVEANTNGTNLVAAPVVAELNNKLAHGRVEIVANDDGTLGYRLDGADTVHPFKSTVKLTTTLVLVCTNNYNFGDVKTVECNILINPKGDISTNNTAINYNAIDSGGKQVGCNARLENTKVSFV